jgi:hypothetical protein
LIYVGFFAAMVVCIFLIARYRLIVMALPSLKNIGEPAQPAPRTRSLIADGSLDPQIGAERSWRDIATGAEQLRDRRVAGKAVLLVDAG